MSADDTWPWLSIAFVIGVGLGMYANAGDTLKTARLIAHLFY